MRNLILIALVALFLGSCSDQFIQGSSDMGEITGQYKTMVVKDNFIYAVNNSEIITFDATNKENPLTIDIKDVGENIENLHVAEKALFIGTKTNFSIFSIAKNGIPEKRSETDHIVFQEEVVQVCDPVVANEKTAYVSLSSERTNGGCGQVIRINELRAYNIQDLNKPTLINTIIMDSPKGLALDGQYLFVANGFSGFSVFKTEVNGSLTLINSIDGFMANDLIAENGKLSVVSTEEIRQYDYSDINNIILYSSLSLK